MWINFSIAVNCFLPEPDVVFFEVVVLVDREVDIVPAVVDVVVSDSVTDATTASANAKLVTIGEH